MKRIFLLPALAVLAILSSCSTSQTMLEVLQPSQIVLPEHITSIAAIDRSKPEKGFANVVEGLFSGESIGQDREGRRRAQLGLTEALSRTPRFSVKTTSIEMSGSKNGANMMPPLPWSEIESICKRYDAQAVAAIESFDTNTDVAYSTSTTKHKEKDGTTTTKVSYTARRNLRVYVGWRLYDPKARVVQDETVISEFDEDTGYGSTQEAATKNLRSLYDATRELSEKIGEKYGMRIAPVWITVSRPFYTTAKGSGQEPMERAHRYVQSGEWEEAAKIWKGLINAPDQKIAGRAAHNLAVAAERIGNLPGALDWAKKAYNQYGNKASQSYIYTLEQRIADQDRLNYQLKART